MHWRYCSLALSHRYMHHSASMVWKNVSLLPRSSYTSIFQQFLLLPCFILLVELLIALSLRVGHRLSLVDECQRDVAVTQTFIKPRMGRQVGNFGTTGKNETENYFRLFLHWGLNKMDAILQTTFSSTFSSQKMFVFWFKFHWNLFQGFIGQ